MENFKTQYLEIMLSDLPAELEEELTTELSKWLYWDNPQFKSFKLKPNQSQFLTKIGFPKDSTGITFAQFDKDLVYEILSNHAINESYFPIGFDGCGSIVFLNIDNDCLYLCDHDNGNEMIFINSSLEKLAETLVFVAKVFIKKTIAHPLAELSKIDEKASQENTFWYWVLKDKK